MDSEDSRVWGNTLASDEAGGAWASKETVWRIPVDAMLCILDISRQHLWSLAEMLDPNSISLIYENYKILQWARESTPLAAYMPGKHEAFYLVGDRVSCLLPAWELWRTLVGSTPIWPQEHWGCRGTNQTIRFPWVLGIRPQLFLPTRQPFIR